MTLAELGAKLREAREGRDMTVADVADRLKIPTRILQGIENGSDTLPRTVYVHHFIKEYALLLGFAQEEVAEWLRGLEGFDAAVESCRLVAKSHGKQDGRDGKHEYEDRELLEAERGVGAEDVGDDLGDVLFGHGVPFCGRRPRRRRFGTPASLSRSTLCTRRFVYQERRCRRKEQ